MLSRRLPSSLARRFALGAGGLATVALLVTIAVSSWVIGEQQTQALKARLSSERRLHAAAVASQLDALAARMAEIANSTILATGLVDSAGRETYLVPFLSGVRQINGVPVQVLFADFEGKEIATNGVTDFTPAQLGWMRTELQAGRTAAAVFDGRAGGELVALQPLVYERTSSPEGAVLYKIALNDLHQVPSLRLGWGPHAAQSGAAALPVEEPFASLGFRVTDSGARAPREHLLSPPYASMFFFALAVFSLVVLAGIALAKVLTRDLAVLEAFARRYIGTALGSERAPVSGSAEVASLATSINGMLERLSEQHRALLAEREKLASLASALQDADRRKDDFLAMLAHELRNPLAPIKNTALVLKAKPLDDPQLSWARDVLDRQVDHMARLLDDLLDVSRITRNKLKLRRRRIALRPVLEAALETSAPLIDKGGHTLRVELPDAQLCVDGDPLRLAQVFANLLNNAANYTPAGGHIDLAVSCTAEDVRVSVADDGVGIATAVMPGIFGMFVRPDSAASLAPGGLGLGLYLVKSLVEMHDGAVEASSAGPGKGSRFTVRLPRVACDDDAVAAGPAATQTASASRRLNVLVVDDNEDAADSLVMLLRLDGHDARVAYGAASALAQAEALPPDVAFFDLGMPEVDGYELARTFRAHTKLASTYLIALTGWGQPDDRERTREAGFDDHVVKPADEAMLRQALSRREAKGAASGDAGA